MEDVELKTFVVKRTGYTVFKIKAERYYTEKGGIAFFSIGEDEDHVTIGQVRNWECIAEERYLNGCLSKKAKDADHYLDRSK